ncbi:MAG: rifampicin phosphotransferase [Acidimicrobiaceae bacterium]|jgi:pyruvate,water dikinase
MATSDGDGKRPGDRLWVVDDVPSRRFPIYTRGNIGEVYPNVITPLCGSVVQAPIARGQEQVFLELGAVVLADINEQDCAVLTGCFGGYLYGNLSVGRLMGARTPTMKPEDVDAQMFGTSDAPPYRRQRGDRNIVATVRLAKMMVRTVRGPDFSWLRAEREETRSWVASRPAPASASEADLLATVADGAERFTPHMRSLLLASAYTGAASTLAERLAAKADVEVRAKTAVGVGHVESAEPARELWHLAQIVSGSAAIGDAFDAGNGIAARLEALGPEADTFRGALDAFLTTYGARGPDEWELASDTWGTNPDIALAAVERIRHTQVIDPSVTLDGLGRDRADAVAAAAASVPRPLRRVFHRATNTIVEGAAAREFAKGTIIQSAYAVRLALFELVRRAQDRGGPDDRRDCWLVTIDELPAFLARPSDFADRISERRARRDYLQARVPPFVFEGRIPDPASWALRGAPTPGVTLARRGDQLEGIGVAPGIARGRARVVLDPSDPSALDPGDVLVAPITDPAWTPLFLVAAAVVVNVGAHLSHAAIVARELGIPAVVSVDGATERLADGALLEVDGARGLVRVLED